MEIDRQWKGCCRKTWQLRVNTTRTTSRKARAQHYETVLAAFHLKEAKRELKVKYKNETLSVCSETKYLGATLDRSLTYCRHLESLPKKLTTRVALLMRLAGSVWGAGAKNSAKGHPCPGAFNRKVLRSSLVPQCSYPFHRPCHQRRFANCDLLPVFYTSEQPPNSRRHPAFWASSQWSHTVSSHTVSIGNPERHVRKASYRGSKQQYRSCSQSLLLLLARATYIMVLFFTHGESHNQRKATGEVTTLSIPLLTPTLSLLRLLPVFYLIPPINWAFQQRWLPKFRSKNC